MTPTPLPVLLAHTAPRPLNRDMAGGLGFDRGGATLLPPLELLEAASALVAAGHPVALLDGQVEPLTVDGLAAKAHALGAGVVVLPLSLPTLEEDAGLARALRPLLPAGCQVVLKTAVGHPPLLLRALVASGCDLAVTGECDLTLAAILAGRERAGTAWLRDGVLAREPESPLRELDRLPLLDRGLLDHARYRYPSLGEGACATLRSSRGCPFPCGYYCPYPLVQGRAWRAMSAARVAREMAAVARAGIPHLLFRDATFTLNRQRVRVLCQLLRADPLPLTWWCETRVDCLDPALVGLMAGAGCRGMNIGVETGDPTLLAGLAKRGVTLAAVADIRRACREAGVAARLLFMVGLPGETRATLLNTFELIRRVRPDYVGVTTVTPYPGTPFHREALARGWLDREADPSRLGGHDGPVAIPPLVPDDLRHAMAAMQRLQRCLVQGDAEGAEGEARGFEAWARAGDGRDQ